jgi:hypothetical protein
VLKVTSAERRAKNVEDELEELEEKRQSLK